MGDDSRYGINKGSHGYVRSFQLLENCFNPLSLSAAEGGGTGGLSAPKIGDVMYADLTYGKAADYDEEKTAVGIVCWVSEDGRSAKIVNLKDLQFYHIQEGNFYPQKPYGSGEKRTYWSTDEKKHDNIESIEDYNNIKLLSVFRPDLFVLAEDANKAFVRLDSPSSYQNRFNEVLSQYDDLIKDSSYKGVNLLSGDTLTVAFNENHSSSFTVAGGNISAAAIGLHQAEWETFADVAASVDELKKAISTLRVLASSLGNSNSVLTTRQNFTESLINVLTEGADKLTLADMNEEAANVLALQTRQQLAVNSLALASQAAGSVLKLF